jgi:hypothetical protein
MHDRKLMAKYFGPALVIAYLVVTSLVVFALNIIVAVKLSVIVVAAVIFAAVLKPWIRESPPFGTETDDEAIASSKGVTGHETPVRNSGL